MVKKELIKLVQTVSTEGNTYRIDCIAADAGHTVICLPPYHCELNPIELVWSDVKGYVAKANTHFKMEGLDALVWKGIEQVTAQKWKNYMSHVIEVEDDMMKIDDIIDDVIDDNRRVVVTLDDDTTSSDESSMNEDDERT